jgi:hypothetical protein
MKHEPRAAPTLTGARPARPPPRRHLRARQRRPVVWNTTVSAGTSVRARSTDPRLVHPTTPRSTASPGALGGNTDDGTLNFEKGKAFSHPLKVVSDVEYQRGKLGAFVRGKAWYDYTLEQKGVRHGSFANGYAQGAKLDDSNYEDLAKFSGRGAARRLRLRQLPDRARP